MADTGANLGAARCLRRCCPGPSWGCQVNAVAGVTGSSYEAASSRVSVSASSAFGDATAGADAAGADAGAAGAAGDASAVGGAGDAGESLLVKVGSIGDFAGNFFEFFEFFEEGDLGDEERFFTETDFLKEDGDGDRALGAFLS